MPSLIEDKHGQIMYRTFIKQSVGKCGRMIIELNVYNKMNICKEQLNIKKTCHHTKIKPQLTQYTCYIYT